MSPRRRQPDRSTRILAGRPLALPKRTDEMAESLENRAQNCHFHWVKAGPIS
jgi:hypothetical protein